MLNHIHSLKNNMF